MAIHLRGDVTASGLWHEIARDDLRIIFTIRRVHVTSWFVFCFSLGILFYFLKRTT